MEEKVKKKTTFWLPPDMIDRMDSWLKADNCRSRNEFVEKALRFYMGYLSTEDNTAYTHSNPWWSSGPNSTHRIASNIYEMYDNSDIRVVSGNYLRLSSLSFRYNVDDRFCKKLGLKSAYINLTGTNLFTIAHKKLRGQDPTQSGSSPSVNLSVRPTYSCNLSITF